MKQVYLFALLLILSGCVSKGKYEALQKQVDSLEIQQETILLGLLDEDNDGIPDRMDKEQGTPAGAMVDAKGVTLDSDLDGIPDYMDKEPFSPVGFKIDPTTGISIKPDFSNILTEEDILSLAKRNHWGEIPVNGTVDYELLKEQVLRELEKEYALGKLPLLKLPLPNSSKEKMVWDKSSQLISKAETLGDLDVLIRQQLTKAGFGYGKYQYFRFDRPNQVGYVVVTDLEYIKTDGTSEKDRWRDEFKLDETTLMEDFISALNPNDEGQEDYFRFFVFFIIQSPRGDISGLTSGKHEHSITSTIPNRGDEDPDNLPLSLRSRDVQDDVKLVAYVYEFIQKQDKKNKSRLKSGNRWITVESTKKHLEKAGIIIK